MDKNIIKMLVAIDVLDRNLKIPKASWSFLQNWSLKQGVEIESVYVKQKKPVIIEQKIDNRPIEVIQKEFFKKAGFKNLITGKILTINSTSPSDEAKLFAKYAKKSNADVIAVISHGRKFINRWLLGSFTESLLANSLVPVLFIKKQKIASRNNRVLFATDFTAASHAAFRLFLKEFGGKGVEVIVYHAIIAVGTVFEAGLPTSTKDEKKWAKTQMAAWMQEGAENGTTIRYVIEDEVTDISKAIVNYAIKMKASLVGLASRTSKFDTFIFGSVAKSIFRTGKVSTWVCGPALLKAMNKKHAIPSIEYKLKTKKNISRESRVM